MEELVPYMRDPSFRLKYDEVLRSIDFVKKYSEEMAVVKVVVVGERMVGCNMAVLVILVKTRGFILVMKELIG